MQKTTILLCFSFFLLEKSSAQITFLNFPQLEIEQCNDEMVESPNISAYSTCSVDSLVILSIDEVFLEDNCFRKTIREYTATDLCGNQASKSYSITQYMDEEAPEIMDCPDDITVSSFADVPQSAPNISALDNCSIDVNAYFTEVTEMHCTDCPKVVRSVVFTDKCTNSSECIQSIFIQNTTITKQFEPSQISIYPNPSLDGTINIEWSEQYSDLQFSLYNSQGQLIQLGNLQANQQSINGLGAGMYSLVFHDKLHSYMHKIIVL